MAKHLDATTRLVVDRKIMEVQVLPPAPLFMEEFMNLSGWNQLIFQVIQSNFKYDTFNLKDIYDFKHHFELFYPSNLNIEAKIRQVLQHLRDRKLLVFLGDSKYQIIQPSIANAEVKEMVNKDFVYLLSNASIPNWVKIGRTQSLENRLKQLYNTSVPLPFNLERFIETPSTEKSLIVEKSIHSIIDTINPSLRRDTLAHRREFFQLSIDQGIEIFQLVEKVINIHK